jgi:hypothetical protein
MWLDWQFQQAVGLLGAKVLKMTMMIELCKHKRLFIMLEDRS